MSILPIKYSYIPVIVGALSTITAYFCTQDRAAAGSIPPLVNMISFDATIFGGGGVFDFTTGDQYISLPIKDPTTPVTDTFRARNGLKGYYDFLVTAQFIRWDGLAHSDIVRISYVVTTLNGQPFDPGTKGTVSLDGSNKGTSTLIDQVIVYDQNVWNYDSLPTNYLTFTTKNSGTFSVADSFTIDYQHYVLMPEPASWVMMLSGFGVLGFLFRARRRAANAEAGRFSELRESI